MTNGALRGDVEVFGGGELSCGALNSDAGGCSSYRGRFAIRSAGKARSQLRSHWPAEIVQVGSESRFRAASGKDLLKFAA
jgi:hypothetical protein